jgi:pleckstrin domain-containing family G protein 5
MSESIKLQQEAIYEMLSTEVSYIRQILTMTDIFMASVMILKSSQRDGLLNDIDMEKLFSNIQDVLNANLLFWKDILLPIKIKLEQTGCAMNPSDLKNGFLKVNIAIFLVSLTLKMSIIRKKKEEKQ